MIAMTHNDALRHDWISEGDQVIQSSPAIIELSTHCFGESLDGGAMAAGKKERKKGEARDGKGRGGEERERKETVPEWPADEPQAPAARVKMNGARQPERQPRAVTASRFASLGDADAVAVVVAITSRSGSDRGSGTNVVSFFFARFFVESTLH